MTYMCRNLCECKYHGVHLSRGTLIHKDYVEGNRFCSVCSVKYLKLDTNRCPCCRSRVKSDVRMRIRQAYSPSMLVKIR